MSKRQFLMLIGVWVAVFLFMGFPSGWDKLFAILTGLLIIILAYRMRSERSLKSANVPYVEHRSSENAVNDMDSGTGNITSTSV